MIARFTLQGQHLHILEVVSLPVRPELTYETAPIRCIDQHKLDQHYACLTSVMSRGLGVSSVSTLYTLKMPSHLTMIYCKCSGFQVSKPLPPCSARLPRRYSGGLVITNPPLVSLYAPVITCDLFYDQLACNLQLVVVAVIRSLTLPIRQLVSLLTVSIIARWCYIVKIFYEKKSKKSVITGVETVVKFTTIMEKKSRSPNKIAGCFLYLIIILWCSMFLYPKNPRFCGIVFFFYIITYFHQLIFYTIFLVFLGYLV